MKRPQLKDALDVKCNLISLQRIKDNTWKRIYRCKITKFSLKANFQLVGFSERPEILLFAEEIVALKLNR